MKNSFALAVLVSLIFNTLLHSQGIFLEKGEAGVFIDGGYTELENGTGSNIGGGFAIGGAFEFGFSISNLKIELDNYYYNYSQKIEVNNNNVSLGVVLIKKKAQLEVNVGYSTSDNSVDVLLLGFNVGSKFALHEKLSCYPIFSFTIGFPQGDNSEKPVTALGLTAPFLISNHVYLGPSIGLSEGNFSWGITAGILISFDTSGSGGW